MITRAFGASFASRPPPHPTRDQTDTEHFYLVLIREPIVSSICRRTRPRRECVRQAMSARVSSALAATGSPRGDSGDLPVLASSTCACRAPRWASLSCDSGNIAIGPIAGRKGPGPGCEARLPRSCASRGTQQLQSICSASLVSAISGRARASSCARSSKRPVLCSKKFSEPP